MLDRGEASLAPAVRKRHAKGRGRLNAPARERTVNGRQIVVGVDLVRG
ncbi:hypothetical protein [Rhizobium laguerreae]|uniref:Uncharacterized protein n=1 Tax=Rhizobium laguerreae TaxID=1076926 RepID=A0A7Y2W786_9HYPH|nr:hypothetical protein [Rhizobium laguerreae]NNH65943.1 hypothetical protein [Rhizobium laguerreae]